MVEEYTTAEDSGNQNPLATSNDSIAAALNNLSHDLDTFQAGNISNGYTHNHVQFLDLFASALTSDLSSHAVSNQFQLARALLDVTWD